MTDALGRIRKTSATDRRCDTITNLILQFRHNGKMTLAEAAASVELSTSGTRKHITDFCNRGLLEIAPNDDPKGSIAFQLIDNDSKIDEFLEVVASAKRPVTLEKQKKEKGGPRLQPLDDEMPRTNRLRVAGRQVYTSFDDSHYRLSLNKNAGEGKRDLLVAHLFGRKPNQEIIDLPMPEIAQA